MPQTITPKPKLRLGARVLLLDPDDRALLIHARDPDDPGHHWWELPGGGIDPGETARQAAAREVTEETGIQLEQIGPCLWTRESRFRYRGLHHWRRDTVFLARTHHPAPTLHPTHSVNEKAGLIEHHWWTQAALADCQDKLLPANLAQLFADIVTGRLRDPIHLPHSR